MTIFGHFWVLGPKCQSGYTYSARNMSRSMNILLLRSDALVRVVLRGFQKGIICQDWVIFGGAMVI